MRDIAVLIAAAAAVVAAGMYMQKRQGQGGGLSVFASGSPDKIISNNALPGQPGWGWEYFDNGVAIGPDGTYYKNGSKVWAPE